MNIYHFEVDTDKPLSWLGNNIHPPLYIDRRKGPDLDKFLLSCAGLFKKSLHEFKEFIRIKDGGEKMIIIYNRRTKQMSFYCGSMITQCPPNVLEACEMVKGFV